MYFLIGLQISCWCFLAFFLSLLLPVVVPTLFEGMLHWNDAGLLFCFLVEYVIVVLLIELREHLVRKASRWLPKFSRKYIRWILLCSNILAYGLCFLMCFRMLAYVQEWSFFIVMQWLVLSMLIWALCGVAIPMSAVKFWKWFKRPQLLMNEWKKGGVSK